MIPAGITKPATVGRYPWGQNAVSLRPLPTLALSLRQEADRIEDIARTDLPAARKALGALLDRVKRLDGNDRETAMSFNARLVTELRQRNPRLFVTYNPPSNSGGQPLPVG